jgi:hypothetical protein
MPGCVAPAQVRATRPCEAPGCACYPECYPARFFEGLDVLEVPMPTVRIELTTY